MRELNPHPNPLPEGEGMLIYFLIFYIVGEERYVFPIVA